MSRFSIYAVAMMLFGAPCVCAQKAYKPVKAALKAGNADEALKKVAELENDSLHRGDPKLYKMGIDAYLIMNDAENEKIYLKQTCDTAKFFNSTYGIFHYALKCDSAERVLMEKKRKKIKYRSGNNSLLALHYANLYAGCRYYYLNKKWDEASRFLRMYVDVYASEIWMPGHRPETQKRRLRCAYLYMKCAYRKKTYQDVFRYEDLLLADSLHRKPALEYMAASSVAMGDTAAYVGYLQQGLKDYPQHTFFFSNMEDYYMQRGQHAEALHLAEQMLKIDSSNVSFLEGKSLALFNLRRYRESIATSLKCLAVNDSLPMPYYYIGACYCNLANEVKLPAAISTPEYRQETEKLRTLYTSARPYLERYRQLAPDDRAAWAPLLYRVYLGLNMGKQFDEMDAILKELKL